MKTLDHNGWFIRALKNIGKKIKEKMIDNEDIRNLFIAIIIGFGIMGTIFLIIHLLPNP